MAMVPSPASSCAPAPLRRTRRVASSAAAASSAPPVTRAASSAAGGDQWARTAAGVYGSSEPGGWMYQKSRYGISPVMRWRAASR